MIKQDVYHLENPGKHEVYKILFLSLRIVIIFILENFHEILVFRKIFEILFLNKDAKVGCFAANMNKF